MILAEICRKNSGREDISYQQGLNLWKFLGKQMQIFQALGGTRWNNSVEIEQSESVYSSASMSNLAKLFYLIEDENH